MDTRPSARTCASKNMTTALAALLITHVIAGIIAIGIHNVVLMHLLKKTPNYVFISRIAWSAVPLFLLSSRLTEQVGILSSPSFWAKMTVVAVLVCNSLLLQARLMPFLIGTAVSLTSWYAALTLGVLGKISASYFEILAYYAVAMIVVALGLWWIRTRLHGPAKI